MLAVSVVTINDEHTKPTFTRKLGVKYIHGICAKFCLKHWFEGDWYFLMLLNWDGFKCDPQTQFQTITS